MHALAATKKTRPWQAEKRIPRNVTLAKGNSSSSSNEEKRPRRWSLFSGEISSETEPGMGEFHHTEPQSTFRHTFRTLSMRISIENTSLSAEFIASESSSTPTEPSSFTYTKRSTARLAGAAGWARARVVRKSSTSHFNTTHAKGGWMCEWVNISLRGDKQKWTCEKCGWDGFYTGGKNS